MGFSISWIGVRGRDQASVLEALGLTDSGEADPFCELGDYAGATIGDWVIVFSNDFNFVTPARLTILSAGCEAVGVTLEEHVMVCGAYGYTDGRLVWSVLHDCEHGLRHLEVKGAPPPELAPVRARLEAQQDEEDAGREQVDFFCDIPLELAKALTTYRHDEPMEPIEDGIYPPLTSLRSPPAPAKAGFFSRLFGKR